MYLNKSDIETIFDNIELEDVIRIWENMYEKATQGIGKNDLFKSHVDSLLNSKVYDEIFNYIKGQIMIMYENGSNALSLESIKSIIEIGEKVTEEQVFLSASRQEGKSTRVSVIMVDKCIRQTFVEKLAEFMNVDLNN